MTSETDYAWAAGIIDGEGHIGMTRCKPGVNRRATIGYQIRISVRMTHEPTVKKLRFLFGGTLNRVPSRNPQKHKESYAWYVGDLKTVEVLEKILPYLITKRDQALLVLDYRKSCYGSHLDGRSLESLRGAYFETLRGFNKKGVW